jgi:MtN3 and saliva related transmembrane protein|tara:strand:+ start:43 stop:297 length:255 start_codon:yes stop_codon:yes gene_type:complete
MNYTDLLGFIAGCLTTAAFVPQVLKTWKTKSTQDLSLGMWSAFCFGVLCWLIYGFMLESYPIIVTNFVTLFLAGTILFFKLKHK